LDLGGSPGADDDDAAGDDDDDASDDDDVDPPDPTTYLEFVSPEPNAEMTWLAEFVVTADGDNPGLVSWSLDGESVGVSAIGSFTGEATFGIDTVEIRDGPHTVTAELASHGLSADLTVVFANGDLLVYDFPATAFDYDSPHGDLLSVPSVAVSLQFQVYQDPLVGSAEFLWGPIYDPNGDWAVGDPSVSLYTASASVAEPWAGLIPNVPVDPFPTGPYYLYPYADQDAEGTQLTGQALVKRSFDGVQAGLLDIDFYFVPNAGFSAVSAPSHPVRPNTPMEIRIMPP
jgi:hypothetical protein